MWVASVTASRPRAPLSDVQSLWAAVADFPASVTWVPVPDRGQAPYVSRHTATIVGKRLFIIGGWNGRIRTPWVHIFNFETETWTHPDIPQDENAPIGLSGHTATPIAHTSSLVDSPSRGAVSRAVVYSGEELEDGLILVVGKEGNIGCRTTSVMLLDTAVMRWKHTLYNDAARTGHIAVHAGNRVLLYGGREGNLFRSIPIKHGVLRDFAALSSTYRGMDCCGELQTPSKRSLAAGASLFSHVLECADAELTKPASHKESDVLRRSQPALPTTLSRVLPLTSAPTSAVRSPRTSPLPHPAIDKKPRARRPLSGVDGGDSPGAGSKHFRSPFRNDLSAESSVPPEAHQRLLAMITQASVQSPRIELSWTAALHIDQYVILLGGRPPQLGASTLGTYKHKGNMPVFLCDLETGAWCTPRSRGKRLALPRARSGHTATYWKGYGIVFGGRFEDGPSGKVVHYNSLNAIRII
ncbi:hypothetical protein CYMTET_44874 [Cymbomonas tetramitiformis]|uniref:Uncharacterized protein n=1 Tax=Cymbomonas tetramitiformis TaxID=36881 RepID=A0AAE0C1F2_9CHLO|nr:hypothetical protein CYMTET_44874 [Cymbomonas tetramitiformis]